MPRTFLTATIVLSMALGASPDAQPSVMSVINDLERCSRTMERAERQFERLSAAIDRLAEPTTSAVSAAADRDAAFVRGMQDKWDYLKNRIERTRALGEKARGGLQNVSGTTCPDCIASDVNLYCRQVESILAEIGANLEKIDGFESAAREAKGARPADRGAAAGNGSTARPAAAPGEAAAGPGVWDARAAALKSRLETARPVLEKTTDTAARVLWQQALSHQDKAVRLEAAGEADKAVTEVDIAERLLAKALAAADSGSAKQQSP